jgi:DNA-binding NarL/FixJ family response regulator
MLPLVSAGKSATNKPWRVMIVDDHEIFRHGLRNILIGIDGFDVVAEASRCSDVLKHATKMPIDLVLMDSSLPDAVGIEAIQRLRELTPPPQVVLLSTAIDDGVLLDAILAGASGYLTKDLPKKDVVNALQSLQRGELALLPPVAANVIRLLMKRCMNLEKTLATERQSTKEKVSLSPSKRSSKTESPSTLLSPLALHRLTSREYKVFQLLCQGLSNKEIAARFSISPYTVGKHVRQILRKLGAVNRTQAVSYASFEGGKPDR